MIHWFNHLSKKQQLIIILLICFFATLMALAASTFAMLKSTNFIPEIGFLLALLTLFLSLSFFSLYLLFTYHENRNAYNQFVGSEKPEQGNDLFTSILANITDGLLVFDQNGIIILKNKAATEMFQKLKIEIQSAKDIEKLAIMNSDRSKLISWSENPIAKSFENEPTISQELCILNPEKGKENLFLQCSSAPLKSKNNELIGAILFFRDIKKSIDARRTLNDYQIQLMISEKMAALGTMAGGVAHEINNPMAIIFAYTEYLREVFENREGINRENALNGLQKIIKASLRISLIIRGLKLISRDGSKDPLLKTQIQDIIDDTLVFCQDSLKRNAIPITITGVGNTTIANVSISCQASQVSQVLLNLIQNSIDSIKELNEKWIKIEVEDYNDKTTISVIDSGKGLDEEIKSKLMTPFFTTKPVGSGTGLGLSISKKIMESHNGTIDIPNHQNTCFRLIFHKNKRNNHKTTNNKVA